MRFIGFLWKIKDDLLKIKHAVEDVEREEITYESIKAAFERMIDENAQ